VPRNRPRKKPATSDPLEGLSISGVARYILDPKHLTTPVSIDPNVRNFCRRLSPQQPVYLEPSPQPWSRLNFCDRNVQKMIQLNGGEAILGYRIWYVKDIYIEAERHAVWGDSGGQLTDLSFYPDGERRILFLPVARLTTVKEETLGRPRAAFHPKAREFVKIQEMHERAIEVKHLDSWEEWQSAQAYEHWMLEQ